jgi:hypothetical protein
MFSVGFLIIFMLAFFQNFKFCSAPLLCSGGSHTAVPKFLTVFSSDTVRRRHPEEKFFLGGRGGELRVH